MLSEAAPVLVATAALAGLTGTWSPCGFSMIWTLARSGHGGGTGTTLAACATFAAGALAGGAATFAGLSLLGSLAGAGSAAALGAGAAIALGAALLEARGARVLPQVRRQVPEHWRRVLPLPLAGALYGVLLGVGFTTFVLTFAVWALAGIAVAAGDPALGAAIGLAFGAGRALPVVVLAPLAERSAGERIIDLMGRRPALLRALRGADALALAACALMLGGAAARAGEPGSDAGDAVAAAEPATDPSAAGGDLAWQQPGRGGVLRRAGGEQFELPGDDPAIGGALLAWRNGDRVTVAQRSATPQQLAEMAGAGPARPQLQIELPGVRELAVSDGWLVFKLVAGGRERLRALPLGDPRRVRTIARGARGTIGRPAVDGDETVFHRAGRGGSRIVRHGLASRRYRVLRRGRATQLLHPSLRGSTVAYVATDRCSQRLVIAPARRGAKARTLWRLGHATRRDGGYEHGRTRQGSGPTRCRSAAASERIMWSTALSGSEAYVVTMRTDGPPAAAQLVRVRR